MALLSDPIPVVLGAEHGDSIAMPSEDLPGPASRDASLANVTNERRFWSQSCLRFLKTIKVARLPPSSPFLSSSYESKPAKGTLDTVCTQRHRQVPSLQRQVQVPLLVLNLLSTSSTSFLNLTDLLFLTTPHRPHYPHRPSLSLHLIDLLSQPHRPSLSHYTSSTSLPSPTFSFSTPHRPHYTSPTFSFSTPHRPHYTSPTFSFSLHLIDLTTLTDLLFLYTSSTFPPLAGTST